MFFCLIKALFFDLKSASWQIEETVDFPSQRSTAFSSPLSFSLFRLDSLLFCALPPRASPPAECIR